MSKNRKMIQEMRAQARTDIGYRAARIPSGKVVLDKKRKSMSRASLKRSMRKEYCY